MDYSITFGIYGYCSHIEGETTETRWKFLEKSDEFKKHLDEMSGFVGRYPVYVCRICKLPSSFYIQSCWFCDDEVECYFYARPSRQNENVKCPSCRKAEQHEYTGS